MGIITKVETERRKAVVPFTNIGVDFWVHSLLLGGLEKVIVLLGNL